jgi:Tfp pilus assembly protein PilF
MTDSQVLALEREAEKLRQAGEFSAAVEKINAALALDPNFVRGHLSLAVLYHKTTNCRAATVRSPVNWNPTTPSITLL